MRIAAAARAPLYRNGIALAANSTLSSLLGFGYWIVATHHASRATVGEASALVAALTALSAVAQLSLPTVLVSFLPRAGAHAGRLVARAYALAVCSSVALGVVFAVVAARVDDAFAPLAGAVGAVTFGIAVAIWSLFSLQDNALTGLRCAIWVPVENMLYSAAKLAALLALGAGVGAIGLLATWVVPAAVGLLPVSGVLFLRLLPRHQQRSGNVDLGGLRGYFAGDGLGLVLSQVGSTLLPILVVVRLGPEAGGAFGIAWMIVQSLDLVAINLGMSLTVEGAHDERELPQLLRGLRTRSLAVVGALAAGGILIAPELLSIFGASYGEHATVVLRLMLLGSIPRVVSVLALSAARAQRRSLRLLGLQGALAVLVPTSAWLLAGPLGLAGVGLAWVGAQAVVAVGALVTEGGRRTPRRLQVSPVVAVAANR